MPVILLTNKYSTRVLAVVKKCVPEGFGFVSLTNASRKELLQNAGKADYFLASGRVPIDKEIIESAKRLKMIQRTGVGIDSLDLETLKEKNIPIYINAGVNAVSVAEHTIMLILSTLRRLPVVNEGVKNGRWEKNDIGIGCHSLFGKTVGIVGMGNIGKNVGKMLRPFGTKLLYYSSHRLKEQEECELGIHYHSFGNLLQQSDIVTLHCSLNSETRGMIGRHQLSLMKRGAFIINTGRGALVDETALINALTVGDIGGAGLDVFAKEPPDRNSPLLKLDNVVVTPHTGGLTLEAFSTMMKEAFENIRLYEIGRFSQIEGKKLQ